MDSQALFEYFDRNKSCHEYDIFGMIMILFEDREEYNWCKIKIGYVFIKI